MKKVFFLAIAVFSFASGFCADGPKIESADKIYVKPHEISISENGMFLLLQNTWVAIEALHADEVGVYAARPEIKLTWTCRHCNKENPWYVSECQHCGKR